MTKVATKTDAVPVEIFNKLQDQLNDVTAELETYRQRSPLVGVCWWGMGGFGIGLTHPINGVNRIALNGYGDKAVIDYATWVRIRNTEHARFGLLVRDDSVIDELHIVGVTAKQDVTKSVNSLTNNEATALLKGTLAKLNEALKVMDSHWGPIHLLKAAEELKMTTPSKIQTISKRRDELATKFRWALLHPHDLKLACEQYEVRGWEQMDETEMVEVLSDIEIKQHNVFD